MVGKGGGEGGRGEGRRRGRKKSGGGEEVREGREKGKERVTKWTKTGDMHDSIHYQLRPLHTHHTPTHSS